MKQIMIAAFLLWLAGMAAAGDFLLVFDNGDGTVTIRAVKSLNTAAPLQKKELCRGYRMDRGKKIWKRLPISYKLPNCDPRFYAWNGKGVVEASEAVKAAKLAVLQNLADQRAEELAEEIWNSDAKTRTNAKIAGLTKAQWKKKYKEELGAQ
jgi:hypothetical protein